MYLAIRGFGYTSYCLWKRPSKIFLLLQDNHMFLVYTRPYKAPLCLYPTLLLMPNSPNQATFFLQFILTNEVTSHSVFTLTLDFILVLALSKKKYNAIISVTCNDSKQVTLIIDANTWSIEPWAHIFLNKPDLIDWGLLEELIINWNLKFFSKF